MKLIIQIPCYNEEETLNIALDALPRRIDGIDEIEYMIINDGSKDKTVEVAKAWGVHHIVNFRRNKGLAYGFMAGIDEALKQGADIIVNTDADNQYCGDDIAKLVAPILAEEADIVIGARPIDSIAHFSFIKKKLQHLGSWFVRVASDTDIPDAPSGFRAFSRDAAMRLHVINEYTYTLETIIQAGREKIAITSVPVRTNAELRPSRLFHSMRSYVKKSAMTIIRAFMMYKPLKFFGIIGMIPFTMGFILGVRYLIYLAFDPHAGHVQSLILAAILLLIGVQTFVVGLHADVMAANRKMIEEVKYHVKKMEYDGQERK